MDIFSIFIACASLGTGGYVTFKARQNDKLSKMSKSDLEEAVYWENQNGRFNNLYSQEIQRRNLNKTLEEKCV